MGSEFNDTPMEPENLTYMHSDYINDIAKANRKILIQCLEKVGFVNIQKHYHTFCIIIISLSLVYSN